MVNFSSFFQYRMKVPIVRLNGMVPPNRMTELQTHLPYRVIPTPIISNMTAIGIGVNGTSLHEDSNVGMEIRDNAAGQVWNSIFTEFSKSILDVEATSSCQGNSKHGQF